jgi:outer membrane immunogenic protein
VIGGGQLGYNFQSNNWVFGIETDFQGSGQTDSNKFIACPDEIGICGGVDNTARHTDELDWFGTTRGRLGYAEGLHSHSPISGLRAA